MITYNTCGGRALRIAVGITALVLLLADGAGAATLTVCPSGCAYSGIQAAIYVASAGDTILVQSGTYYENVNVNKKLTLRGIGMPVVDAKGSGSAITLAMNGITLEGFNATGGGSYPRAGINVISNNNTLSGNNASNNEEGIYLSSSSDNMLINNNASNNWNGIELDSSSNNTLSGNNANSNIVAGIVLDSYSNSNTLSGNIALNNNGFGIYISSSSNSNTLRGNNANSNNGNGITLWSSSNNMLNDNNASNNDGTGITLESYSNSNTLRGNNASNNGEGIYLSSSSGNTLSSNNASNNNYEGISLFSSSGNTIYNNYFSNTNNAYDDGNNRWNITKQFRTNIINGSYLGGNYWSDYFGKDTDGDGLGDTLLPYNSLGYITNGGDYLPVVIQVQSVTSKTIAIEAVQSLEIHIASFKPTVFKNDNMQNTLLNKLNAVIANIEQGNNADALGQLQNDVLKKTDGCANSGAPDKNDWIKDCESQGIAYPYILDVIAKVKVLL